MKWKCWALRRFAFIDKGMELNVFLIINIKKQYVINSVYIERTCWLTRQWLQMASTDSELRQVLRNHLHVTTLIKIYQCSRVIRVGDVQLFLLF